jgi:hypothetical protein
VAEAGGGVPGLGFLYRVGLRRDKMTRGSGSKDPVERARRKLAKARLALNAAQERHAEARVQGRQEIERARLRAAKLQAKAAERVERRAEKVVRAEGRLLSLTSNVGGAQAEANGLSLPDGIANRIGTLEDRLSTEVRSPILLPEAVEESGPPKRKRARPDEETASS